MPVHINKDKGLGREYTQRSRSFLYASIAATVAHAYGLSRIRLYETHWGTCSQCIDRRFAVLGAGAGAWDPGEAYGVDLLRDARAEGEHRTMLAAYVQTASQVAKLSAVDFYARYGEIGRVLNHLDGPPDLMAARIYELYRRHGPGGWPGR